MAASPTTTAIGSGGSAALDGHPPGPDPTDHDPTTRDRITLTGITARGRHGVYDFEREQGQTFVVDVSCTMDLDAAARSDDLGQTLDYFTLATDIKADIEGEPLDLIEALAMRVAQTCLRVAAVETVEVTVHKPEAPMPVRVADVAVTLVRSRA